MDCLDDVRPCLEKQRATLANVKERRIEAGDTLGRFEIIDLLGYSTDSIGYYDAATRELFAGDTILKHTSTNAIIDPLVTGEYMQANLLRKPEIK